VAYDWIASKLDKFVEANESLMLRTFAPVVKELEAKRPWERYASDDDKAAKFKKGEPADPTKNMSEDDKAKWKSENERNKDKFKKDAATEWVDLSADSEGKVASSDPWKKEAWTLKHYDVNGLTKLPSGKWAFVHPVDKRLKDLEFRTAVQALAAGRKYGIRVIHFFPKGAHGEPWHDEAVQAAQEMRMEIRYASARNAGAQEYIHVINDGKLWEVAWSAYEKPSQYKMRSLEMATSLSAAKRYIERLLASHRTALVRWWKVDSKSGMPGDFDYKPIRGM
jgi:hypothetical protein